MNIITIEQEGNYYRVECPCGWFQVCGSPKSKGAVAYLTAKKEAKSHNRRFHHKSYKISTMGSEVF